MYTALNSKPVTTIYSPTNAIEERHMTINSKVSSLLRHIPKQQSVETLMFK